MLVKNIVLLICIVLLFSCKHENKSQAALPAASEKIPVSIQNLQGSWALQKSGPADFKFNDQQFEIMVDSQIKSIPYELVGDSLTLLYPDFKYNYKVIAFQGDSIQFMDETSQHTYHKVK